MVQKNVPIQVSSPSILDSSEDYLAKGADAKEFRETVIRAIKIFYQPEAHNQKNVGYAWNAGREFQHIKPYIKRGAWTAWKNNCEFASPRKIEMYMMIFGGFESEEEATSAATSIVSAAALITARRKEERKRAT